MDGTHREGARTGRWGRVAQGMGLVAALVVAGGRSGERGRSGLAGSLGPRSEPATVPMAVAQAPDSGFVLERLAEPVVVQVQGQDGEWFRGARLRLVTEGDDSVGAASVPVGADGRAVIADWHLGAAEGAHRLRAQLIAAGDTLVRGEVAIAVRATSRRGQGAVVLASPTWALTARRGLALPRAVELRVLDVDGRAVPQADVHVVASGGALRIGGAWEDARRGLRLRADAEGYVRLADWALPADSTAAVLHVAVRGPAALRLERRATRAEVPALEIATFFETTHRIWDMAFAPDSTFFYTRRDRGVAARRPDGTIIEYPTPADAPPGAIQFMYGLATDPAFARTRWLYVVQASERGAERDLRLVRYRVSEDYRRLEERTDLRTGFHLGTGNGRQFHMAIRGGIVRFLPDSTLIVTIGFGHDLYTAQGLEYDAAKTFHLRRDGTPVAAVAPIPGAARDVFTMGHRNPQGLAVDRRRNAVFEAEHGPDYDDEVNRLEPGRNYGWFPLCADGVSDCEYAPNAAGLMTDRVRIPTATEPLWKSGRPAFGTSGLVLLEGGQWGAWDGRLLALQLRGLRGLLLGLNDDGTAITEWQYVLEGTQRLRTGIVGPDGALYVAPDESPVLRIMPRLP